MSVSFMTQGKNFLKAVSVTLSWCIQFLLTCRPLSNCQFSLSVAGLLQPGSEEENRRVGAGLTDDQTVVLVGSDKWLCLKLLRWGPELFDEPENEMIAIGHLLTGLLVTLFHPPKG